MGQKPEWDFFKAVFELYADKNDPKDRQNLMMQKWRRTTKAMNLCTETGDRPGAQAEG